MDVQKSKNYVMGKESRTELGNLAIQWLNEVFLVENLEIEEAFIEKNKYRNIYEGYTWFSEGYPIGFDKKTFKSLSSWKGILL